jgi:hypothetical protein
MPGLFVFSAWISQANDQFNGSHDRGPSLEWWITSPHHEGGESGRKLLIYHECKLRVLARFLATFQSAMFPHSDEQSELLCCAFFGSFWSNTWSVDVGYCLVIAVCQSNELDALGALRSDRWMMVPISALTGRLR